MVGGAATASGGASGDDPSGPIWQAAATAVIALAATLSSLRRLNVGVGGIGRRCNWSVHQDPTVDVKRLAGDVAGFVGGKIQNGVGNVVGHAQSANRNQIAHTLQFLRRQVCAHVGLDLTRRHRIDGYAEGASSRAIFFVIAIMPPLEAA